MTADIAIYTVVLAFVNFPFVMLVERHVRTHAVKPVYSVQPPAAQRRDEIRNSLTTTPIHALLFAAFVASGFLRVGPETPLRVLSTFALTFLWTEVWHYASHAAMHTRRLHFIHREHHKSRVTGPWSSVSFSFLEKLIFSSGILGLLALVSQWHALSAFGIFAYYVLYFFTNTLGHANFEFRAPGYYKRFMGRVFNSPSYHAMHHARYTRNFGLLTPWLDTAFGTAWADVDEVQTLAALRQPLRALNERPASSESAVDARMPSCRTPADAGRTPKR